MFTVQYKGHYIHLGRHHMSHHTIIDDLIPIGIFACYLSVLLIAAFN